MSLGFQVTRWVRALELREKRASEGISLHSTKIVTCTSPQPHAFMSQLEAGPSPGKIMEAKGMSGQMGGLRSSWCPHRGLVSIPGSRHEACVEAVRPPASWEG